MANRSLWKKNNLVNTFKTAFNFIQNYIMPNKDILFRLEKEELIKRKEHQIAVNKVNIQRDKINRAYGLLGEFKK